MKKIVSKATYLVFLFVLASSLPAAQCILPDNTFNSNGVAISAGATSGGNSTTLDGSGKIVAVGKILNSNYDMAVWRYNTNGTLDTTFNSTGIATNDAATGTSADEYGNAVVIDAEGKILIAGESADVGYKFTTVWKYKTDGTLDTTFGSGGIMTQRSLPGVIDHATDIAIDSNGKILLSGISNSMNMIIWRLNSNGTIDNTFNATGYFVSNGIAGGIGPDEATSLAIDSSGRIVVCGYSQSTSNRDMALWRLTPAGTLDTTFNLTGYYIYNNSVYNGNDQAKKILIGPDMKIYICGYSQTAAAGEIALWRLNSNGTPDTTFGVNGFATYVNSAAGSGMDTAYDMLLQSDGKLLVAGDIRESAGVESVALWRYNSNGTLDTTFNGTGIMKQASIAGGSGHDFISSISVDSAGKIVCGGQAFDGSINKAFVARYLNNCDLVTPDGPIAIGNVKIYKNVINPNKGDKTKIQFNTFSGSWAKVSINDETGRKVIQLFDSKNTGDGTQTVYWDGRDSAGKIAGTGIFFIAIQTSKYTSVEKTLIVK